MPIDSVSHFGDAAARLRVLVIGDLMLDHYIWGEASRISPEAPVPVVEVQRDTFAAGGAGNAAANLAGLGVNVTLMGSLGSDEHGAAFSAALQSSGVQLAPLPPSTKRATITKTRVMAQRQQLCRLDREADPEAFALAPEWKAALDAEPWDAVLVSDYAKGVVTDDVLATLRIWRSQRSPAPLLALDPKPRRALDCTGFDLLTPNRSEALQLAGLPSDTKTAVSDAELCRRIHGRFAPRDLVVTLGAGGLLLCRNGEVLGRRATVARDVFDVAGAGDTVVAVLTAAFAAGADLAFAAELANRAAGVVVGQVGTVAITRAALEQGC
ncbi:MAG: bifunctional heptose 7-phosphate kinase/heptose 1-phosphate adenyltransferase [Opitutales bacterium]